MHVNKCLGTGGPGLGTHSLLYGRCHTHEAGSICRDQPFIEAVNQQPLIPSSDLDKLAVYKL